MNMNQKKKMKMAVTSSSTSLVEQLPPELTLDIFSRLPAESVLRCKCVCRSWRSILRLNKRQFAKMHLHHQQQQQQQQFDFIIRVNRDKHGTKGRDFELLQYFDHPQDQVAEVKQDDDHSMPLPKISYTLTKINHSVVVNDRKYLYRRKGNFSASAIGSCNGLVCLAYHGDPVYVCNPITGEYVNLPYHKKYTYAYKKGSRMTSGFGYHPLTDEYKVVRIYCEFEDRIGHAEVYTVGKDCGRWRSKEQLVSHDWLDNPGVSINGTIYWIARKAGVMAFDLAEEEFYVPKVPPEWSCSTGFPIIGNLGGCVYLSRALQRPLVDVWVMKNNCTRNNESWVKQFSIPRINWTICAPCALTNNGDILLWYSIKDGREKYLCRYNKKTGSFKLSTREEEEEDTPIGKTMKSPSWGFGNAVFPYVKSFISLKHDIGEGGAKPVERHEKERENRQNSIFLVKKMKKKRKSKVI